MLDSILDDWVSILDIKDQDSKETFTFVSRNEIFS